MEFFGVLSAMVMALLIIGGLSIAGAICIDAFSDGDLMKVWGGVLLLVVAWIAGAFLLYSNNPSPEWPPPHVFMALIASGVLMISIILPGASVINSILSYGDDSPLAFLNVKLSYLFFILEWLAVTSIVYAHQVAPYFIS